MPTYNPTPAELARLLADGAVIGPAAAMPTTAVPVSDFGSEKAFQAAVITEAKRHGWRVYHTHDSRKSEAGFPDLVMVRGERCIFAELKREKGRPSAAQSNWLDDLRAVTTVKVELWRPSDWPEIVETLTQFEPL